MDQYMNWMEGPELRNPRAGHCSVQIDNCKAAVIGGNVMDPDPFIDVYDFVDGRWYEGPK